MKDELINTVQTGTVGSGSGGGGGGERPYETNVRLLPAMPREHHVRQGQPVPQYE
jgi:hypothetical protein